MNKEIPRSSESWIRMLVRTLSSGVLNRTAQTGAPASARTTLAPIARRRVLFPDMFEPVMSRKLPGGPTVTLFDTRARSGRSG